MSRPAVFVDRDGTLNRDCPYCHDPKDLYVFADAIKLLKEYSAKGYLIIIVTNQSGLHRGYFTADQLNEFNKALTDELEKNGVRVDDIFVCPHTPEENCHCRKPETGMIEQAMRKYDIDLSKSIMVGDRDDLDGELARKLGLKFVLVSH